MKITEGRWRRLLKEELRNCERQRVAAEVEWWMLIARPQGAVRGDPERDAIVARINQLKGCGRMIQETLHRNSWLYQLRCFVFGAPGYPRGKTK